MDRASVLGETAPFPLKLAGARTAELAELRESLAAWGYTERGACRALGLDEIYDLNVSLGPVWERYRLRDDEPAHVLLRALFLHLPVPREELQASLPAGQVELLAELGLLVAGDEGTLQCPVCLYPFEGLLLATDWPAEPELATAAVAQRVMYLGADSCQLAHMAAAGSGGRCLDLCTGSGVVALAAAPSHQAVLGVDVNARAVCFARFNALLNGLPSCSFREADLYEGLVGQRFERIVANPPFVPSPKLGTVLFRDGGRGGEEVLSRIVAGLQDHLLVGGIALIRTDLVTHADRSYFAKLQGWLSGGDGFEALALRTPTVDPMTYALQHNAHLVQGTPAWQAELFRWLDAYRAERIQRIHPGYLLLRRRGAGPLRFRALDVTVDFGRGAPVGGLCEGLLERTATLGDGVDAEQRLELDCEAGEVELRRPEQWPGQPRLDYDLARTLDELSDSGFTARTVVAHLQAQGHELGADAVEELSRSVEDLLLMGFVRRR